MPEQILKDFFSENKEKCFQFKNLDGRALVVLFV